MPPHHCGRCALCAVLGLLCLAAHGQTPASLPDVIVTGNPLRSSDIAQPSSTLAGEGLVLRRGSTLGETLDGLPGVSSSYFGPNANRPVIRGQDGDRIRVLNNAGASVDASSLSFDHAVPVEPLVVERIEVLRGPAALLYGGSAVGGVVNAIDNRIPSRKISAPSGATELRVGGPASERAASALVETGGDGFALHVDAFRRITDDLRVPPFDRSTAGGSERRDRIVNSASRANGGAFGGSWLWNHGYLGASVDTYRNDYGSVAEEDVTIRMKRDKLALAGEVRDLGGALRTVRGQLQRTDYRHEEVDGAGAVGTTFLHKAATSRFEFEHAPFALGQRAVRGVFGVQSEDSRFAALGAEAFVPSTKTRQVAAFVLEELALGRAKLNVGARAEHTRIDSAGDEGGGARFGPAQSRSFNAASASAGVLFDLSGGWQWSGSLAYTQRAPTYYELYANGVHLATAAFEAGNSGLPKETSTNLDVALQWKTDRNRFRAGVYASRFGNYIALLRSGGPNFVDASGRAFPVYAYSAVPAELHGIEMEGARRVLDGPQTVDLESKLDWQRATNRATGEPLPRIAPLRVTLAAITARGDWSGRAELIHAARQSRFSSDDAATAGYTLVNLATSLRLRMGGADGLLFAKLTNVGNTLAYNAATIAAVRSLAPLPGRGLLAGLQLSF
jgi:iron complex outermembrane receptor protein